MLGEGECMVTREEFVATIMSLENCSYDEANGLLDAIILWCIDNIEELKEDKDGD
jgi:hypothetical protein